LAQGSKPTAAPGPTVKQHLAVVRMLFDWLVVGQIVPYNPAHAVRGPKHVVKKGKTPVLSTEKMHDLFVGFPAVALHLNRGFCIRGPICCT
jgi:integrase/recombinase XerD